MIDRQLYLIALVGIPGSGKSGITARSTLPVVSSDTVRAELLGDDSCQDQADRVWAEVHRRLAAHLARGESVVLDATNLDPDHRAPLLEIARAAGAAPVAWRITTPHTTARRYNERRGAAGGRLVPAEAMDRMIGLFNRRCSTTALKAEGWTVRNITTEVRPGPAVGKRQTAGAV
jgi:predicted kinase